MHTYEALLAYDPKELGKRLVAYALWEARNCGWRYGRSEPARELAVGRAAEDIVQQAFLLVASGERQWDPARGSLETFLREIIWSEVRHLAESAARRRERTATSLGAEGDGTEQFERAAHAAAKTAGKPPPVTPEEDVLRKEETAVGSRISSLMDAVADEAELLSVVEAIMDGVSPQPRFLAESLGTSVSDINNRLKRLRRRAVDLQGDSE